MSKFNLSESEKNRILGLHKTKKENVILQEQINYRGKGYTFPIVPAWAMENPCFSVLKSPDGGFNIYCRREPHMGEPIDGRTGGIQAAVYLGISPSKCCPSLTAEGPGGERNQVFREELPDWGYDCVIFRKVNYGDLGPVVTARCKFGTANLPIGFETIGDFISIEDCCKLGGIDNEGVEGEEDNVPGKSNKCNWRQEHTDVPTENRRETYLRRCIKGDKVKMVQEKLLELDIDVVGTADGLFGDKTRKGVKTYQEKFDLQVDGVVGPQTWNHMFPEAVEGEEEEVIDIYTDEEAEEIIDSNKGQTPDKKTCRDLIKATSFKIKGGLGDELKNDQALIKTLGYCFNRHDFPLIAGHGRRVRKELGLKKKNNPV